MAVTVAENLQDVDACEAVTDWSVRNISGTLGALARIDATDEEQPPIEGTYCLTWDQDAETGGFVHDLGVGGTDLSDAHVYQWGCCFTAANLEDLVPSSGQSGVFFIAEDTSGNAGYWHVAGADTYAGGWKCFVAYLGNTPDTNNGTNPTMTSIRYIGLGWRHGAKSKATHNMFIDVIRYSSSDGQGLLVTTSSSSEVAWSDIAAGDIHYGILEEEGGSFVVQGGVTLGDASNDCEFKDSQQSVVFRPIEHLGADHYVLKLVGGAATTTEFEDGSKTAGGAGIRGSTIRANDFTFDFDDANIDNIKLYGTSFTAGGDFLFPASVSGTFEVLNVTFTDCGEVYSEDGTFTNCSFIDSPGRALRIDETDHSVTYATFIACDVGVHFPVAGTFSISNFSFSGSVTADVENSANATNAHSYADTNKDTEVALDANNNGIAQSFTVGGAAIELSSCAFWLKETGNPTGNVVCKIYADSGGLPSGSALATSELIAATDIGTGGGVVDFSFNGPDHQIQLSASTTYHVAVEYSGGDASNYISVGTDSSSPGDAGSMSVLNGSWAADATQDAIYYVRKDGVVTINSTDSNPSTILNSGTPRGCVVIVSSVTLKVTVLDEDGDPIENAQTGIYATETAGGVTKGDELIDGSGGADTNASGIVTNTGFNYAGDVEVEVRSRKSSAADSPKYKHLVSSQKITSSGLDVIVTLIEDPIAQ